MKIMTITYKKMYEGSKNIFKRNTSVCYFDCTNYYFEIEKADNPYINEITGEVIDGLRMFGISKENRPNPIVQMGLFVDKDGITLTMSITPGNTNERKYAIPLEEKVIKKLKRKQFIYCADVGLSSYRIREFNSFSNRAFIVTQSIKKLNKPLQETVFNDVGYRLLSSD